MWLIALNVLALLALACSRGIWAPRPTRLKPAPPGIHPEWYFMSSFQMLKLFGNWFPGAVGEVARHGDLSRSGWCCGCWFRFTTDRATPGGAAAARTYFGLFVLAVLVVTTIWGYAAYAGDDDFNRSDDWTYELSVLGRAASSAAAG